MKKKEGETEMIKYPWQGCRCTSEYSGGIAFPIPLSPSCTQHSIPPSMRELTATRLDNLTIYHGLTRPQCRPSSASPNHKSAPHPPLPPPPPTNTPPQSFLHLVSLRTAAEFITLILLINKLSGLYGILALLTGYHLNPLQLSHYIYSLLCLGTVAWLYPAIRKPEEPLKNVALAWIYVLDAVINSAYTALFGAGWFLVLAQEVGQGTDFGADVVPGADTIGDTAGFTNPEHNVTQVDVVAKPAEGLLSGQKAIAYGSQYGTLGAAIFQSGSMASVTVLGLLWIIRTYFCILMMSYARSILRKYVASTSTDYSHADDPTMAENPFRAEREEGNGWKGKLGRFMLRFPTKRYWLGKDEAEDEWVRATSGRFESGRGTGLRIKVPENGVGERERRARSGTGPPLPVAVKGKE